jgi:hypothetical protein
MAQLSEAIARYHKLLRGEAYRDLTWAQEFQERIQQQHASDSGRLGTVILRPHFISERELTRLTRATEHLAAILDQIEAVALKTPSLLDRMQLLPAEKMLAAIPSGYSRFSITSRMDAHLWNGLLSLQGFEAGNASGLACSERLADLFLDLTILKQFKRGRYNISKLGTQKYLLTAVLQTWKEFGGKHKPNLAVVGFGSDPGEDTWLAELFNQHGVPARIVSPDDLEYTNGKLRAADFEIHIVFRRLSTRELLVRFDLSHPLLRAYRDRAVCLVNSFRSEIAHRRALFDLVTDETITAHFPTADRKLIRDFVPWTRVVAQKKTKYWEREIDLPEFILRSREQLVLRPNQDIDGHRVFIGAELDARAWERALRLALRTPYVVQERTHAARQLFPVFQYGELQMKEAEISLHPHVFNGKMHGASAVLRMSAPESTSPPFILPVLLLEGK